MTAKRMLIFLFMGDEGVFDSLLTFPTSFQDICGLEFDNMSVLYKEKKTNGGYKHYPYTTHGLIKIFWFT